MKRFVTRSILTLALSAGVGLSTVGPALANGRAPRTHHGTSNTANATYRADLHAWVAQRQAIATAFRAAVASARSTFDTAKAQATTSAERYAASTAFVAAIALAAENRSAALTALGPAPKNPNGSLGGGTTSTTAVGSSVKKSGPATFKFHLS